MIPIVEAKPKLPAYEAYLFANVDSENLSPFRFTAEDDKAAIYKARNLYGWFSVETVVSLAEEPGEEDAIVYDGK